MYVCVCVSVLGQFHPHWIWMINGRPNDYETARLTVDDWNQLKHLCNWWKLYRAGVSEMEYGKRRSGGEPICALTNVHIHICHIWAEPSGAHTYHLYRYRLCQFQSMLALSNSIARQTIFWYIFTVTYLNANSTHFNLTELFCELSTLLYISTYISHQDGST